MKKNILILAMSVLAGVANAQVLFTEWNFNSPVGDGSTTTGTAVANLGTGSVANLGGVTNTFAAGGTGVTAPLNSTDPNNTDDSAYNSTNYAGQGLGSGTTGVRFNVSTAQGVGYNNVIVQFDLRTSNTASRWFQFEYTLDGTNFTSAGLTGTQIESVGGDSWNNDITFNFSSIAGANNNANFGFRVTSIFAPSTSTYLAARPTSSYASTGTVRFDMVQVSGQPVPEPATMAALALGLAFARKRKTR